MLPLWLSWIKYQIIAQTSSTKNKPIRPVNLHPLFLFWKPGSVCDPEKNWAPTQKSRMQKTKVGVIQKEKKQPVLFSFWITMTLFFCTLLFAKSRVPEFLKVPDPKNILGRSDKLEQWVQIDWASNWYFKPFSIIGINST